MRDDEWDTFLENALLVLYSIGVGFWGRFTRIVYIRLKMKRYGL